MSSPPSCILVCLLLLLSTNPTHSDAQADMQAMFAEFLKMMATSTETPTTTNVTEIPDNTTLTDNSTIEVVESTTEFVNVTDTITESTTDNGNLTSVENTTDVDNTTTTEAPKTSPTSCCEDGWVAFGGSCYLLPRIKHRYLDAIEYCKSANAGPIVINSIAEIEVVLSNLSMSRENTWIGYSDQFQPGAVWPTWYDGQGTDVKQFKWLTPTGNQGFINGAISCAAYFNLFPGVGSYFHYYNCMLPFYFACERNTTDTKPPATGKSEPEVVADMPEETKPTTTEATTTTPATTTAAPTTTTTTPTTTTTTPTTTTTTPTTTTTTPTTTTTTTTTTTPTTTTTTTTTPTTTTTTAKPTTTTTVDPMYAQFLAFMEMQNKDKTEPTKPATAATTASPTKTTTKAAATTTTKATTTTTTKRTTAKPTATTPYDHQQSLAAWNEEQARLRQQAIQRMYPNW